MARRKVPDNDLICGRWIACDPLDRHHRLDGFSRVADMGCYEYMTSGVMIVGR